MCRKGKLWNQAFRKIHLATTGKTWGQKLVRKLSQIRQTVETEKKGPAVRSREVRGIRLLDWVDWPMNFLEKTTDVEHNLKMTIHIDNWIINLLTLRNVWARCANGCVSTVSYTWTAAEAAPKGLWDNWSLPFSSHGTSLLNHTGTWKKWRFPHSV